MGLQRFKWERSSDKWLLFLICVIVLRPNPQGAGVISICGVISHGFDNTPLRVHMSRSGWTFFRNSQGNTDFKTDSLFFFLLLRGVDASTVAWVGNSLTVHTWAIGLLVFMSIRNGLHWAEQFNVTFAKGPAEAGHMLCCENWALCSKTSMF